MDPNNNLTLGSFGNGSGGFTTVPWNNLDPYSQSGRVEFGSDQYRLAGSDIIGLNLGRSGGISYGSMSAYPSETPDSERWQFGTPEELFAFAVLVLIIVVLAIIARF